ncbi:hypothetical protein N752_05940 [Desulforamulus aquiferis]|nr:hypothetical protein [Desulforamulus aquiferis]RYD06067.1 hypothetical protein N752_05940 [Desulforamulus aquiferis]
MYFENMLAIILGISLLCADWLNISPKLKENRKYLSVGIIILVLFVFHDTLNILP